MKGSLLPPESTNHRGSSNHCSEMGKLLPSWQWSPFSLHCSICGNQISPQMLYYKQPSHPMYERSLPGITVACLGPQSSAIPDESTPLFLSNNPSEIKVETYNSRHPQTWTNYTINKTCKTMCVFLVWHPHPKVGHISQSERFRINSLVLNSI